jgi:hypothetical protein
VRLAPRPLVIPDRTLADAADPRPILSEASSGVAVSWGRDGELHVLCARSDVGETGLAEVFSARLRTAGGLLQPDSRWQNSFEYTRQDGIAIRVSSFDSLEAIGSKWARMVSDEVPDGISDLLATSRSLVAHAWFKYESLAVACLVAVQAVEATCRQVYPNRDRVNFQTLFAQAVQEGRIPAALAPRVDTKPGTPYALPELRNRLAHPGGQQAFPPAAAGPILAASHQIVSHLAASA